MDKRSNGMPGTKLRLITLMLALALLAGCAAPLPSLEQAAAQADTSVAAYAQELATMPPTPSPTPTLTPTPVPTVTPPVTTDDLEDGEGDEAESPEATPQASPTAKPDAVDPNTSTIDVNPLYLVPNNKAAFDARELMVEECYLGDTRMDVESVLGKPAQVRLTEDDYYYWTEYHYSKDTVLSFSSTSMDSSFILRSASVSDPTLRGPRGIRVGDTLEKLLSTFMIRDVEMTDEQYDRVVWSRDFDEPLLYATVYDVEMFSSRLEENAPFTAVLKPWGYVHTVQDEDDSTHLQVVYADVLQYDPFDIQEYMTTDYDTSYLIFDIKNGYITHYEWYTTIYA